MYLFKNVHDFRQSAMEATRYCLMREKEKTCLLLVY